MNKLYSNSESSSTLSGFLLCPDSCDIPMSHDLPDLISGIYSWDITEYIQTENIKRNKLLFFYAHLFRVRHLLVDGFITC